MFGLLWLYWCFLLLLNQAFRVDEHARRVVKLKSGRLDNCRASDDKHARC